ncbi:MAG TPA: hypothetical protein DDZ44_07070 [Syntrophomonas wolfei]|uniref:Uncharacterized protein n=1 Tax=Syntrophomonas wolfei TaxID=863 RepID=A0A354YWF6_9FIRM|nr:hypothetical protein [Syntrophomonas wolfei]
MVKCDLSSIELEEMHELFATINQARVEIQAGITAQAEYAETVNEINCLSIEDSEYGEELCRKALNQIGLIKAAELAAISIHDCQAKLAARYGGGPAGDGSVD